MGATPVSPLTVARKASARWQPVADFPLQDAPRRRRRRKLGVVDRNPAAGS